MEVSDQELRSLVRDAIARHTGRPALSEPRDFTRGESKGHTSHGRFLMLAPSEDGQCVIEPAVRCNHCGYCQSYGH
jgi:hypothetical protein